MALEITPGYDFKATEVPTKAKFLQQAQNVTIDGIPVERIQETILSIVFGNDTGASGGVPPDDGWLWVDPAGNRFTKWVVGGDHEDTKAWSAQGGWETSRFRSEGFNPGEDISYGVHMWHGGGFRIVEDRLDMDADFSPWGATMHSVDSPASSIRIIGRGLFVANTQAQATETHVRTRRPGILTDAPGQFGWRVLNMRDGFKPHFAGTIMGAAPGSVVGATNVIHPEVSAWFVMRNLGRS